MTTKYRLLTRSDFDGLVCAMLLKELDMLGDIQFVHPKDVQDGRVDVTDRDILTNLPYVPGCHLCFDHHDSEDIRNEGPAAANHVLDTTADSAARAVYEYFGGQNRFPQISQEMLEAVDQADSARFSREEVLHPRGWALLAFLMDARTGLGRFHHFRVSNYQLMMDLISYCKDHTIEQILELPDVEERVALYREHQAKFEEQLHRCSTLYDNLVVLDLRQEDTIYVGNRFLIYALFPQVNVSMHVLWGKNRQNTVFTIGKSIFNRTSAVNIGALTLEYGGGGHEAAGTCQVPHDQCDRVREELIVRLTDHATITA